MKRKLTVLMIMGALLLSAAPVWAEGDFYVVAGGGGVGTKITSLPYNIKDSGFYYLAKNLAYSETSGAAISVFASDVTLDLMGCCLSGPGKTSGTSSGIYVNSGFQNVEVRNGSINNFGGCGIVGTFSNNNGIRVLNLRVRDTGNIGISLFGNDNLVAGCSVLNTNSFGIYCPGSSLIKGNQVAGNADYGIYVGAPSTIVGNVCRANGWSGIYSETFGSAFLDNQAVGNGGYGIYGGGYDTASRNTARANTQEGIYISDYGTIANNTTDRLYAGPNCTKDNNTVY